MPEVLDSLVPLSKAPQLFPRCWSPSVSVIRLWIREGRSGCKLGKVMIGGRIHVSPEHVAKFIADVTAATEARSCL